MVNIYTSVFSENDEKWILDYVFDLQARGRAGLLRPRTYAEPRKWMHGKGRETIQCGRCYNFVEDRQGNPPGILRYDEVDSMPYVIKRMVKRLIRWSILLPDRILNSCIVNIYDEGSYIPPHIDHHDFVRPFCIVFFLSKSNILFRKEIDIIGPREFRGSVDM
ncbi:RNA demethylase ALKBH5-like [Phalaenopsis equestris]|uniref:RNA demethylase ALKBH5-like n=1 Tax=Phalaenopsis equestris TaxID=78828 RepID=UPI0009E56E13|nr:RNA demethylase ALKBH5-like [Phalaenopsis equestris]